MDHGAFRSACHTKRVFGPNVSRISALSHFHVSKRAADPGGHSALCGFVVLSCESCGRGWVHTKWVEARGTSLGDHDSRTCASPRRGSPVNQVWPAALSVLERRLRA